MIRLNLNPEPVWLEIAPGVRMRLRPCTSALIGAAQRDPLIGALSPDASTDEKALAMAKAVAALAVLEWEGFVGDDDYPLAPNPATIAAALDLYPVFEAFQVGYMQHALLLASEKNGSAPLPSGTSEGATATAEPADPNARTARRGSTSR